jgi:Type II secretion system (T2SS), protein G
MTKHRLTRPICIISLFLLTSVPTHAELSQKQARNLIAKAAGMSLPSSAVRVESVTSSGTTAEASAEIELAFRFERHSQGRWRLKELRTGEARWEDIDSIVQALNLSDSQSDCDPSDQAGRLKADTSLSTKKARCLIASLLSVPLPSDAVRIKSISGLALGPEPSALAVSSIRANFRFVRDSRGWRVSEFHSGTRQWLKIEGLESSIASAKLTRTNQQMNLIASALDAYKRDRGSFVVADKHSVMIDHLTPHYLHQVLRLDSWQHPFRYQGDREHFTLRSLGPDGKENTADDIVVSR